MKKKIVIGVGILTTILGSVVCAYAFLTFAFGFGGDVTGVDHWILGQRDEFYVGARYESGTASRLPLLDPYFALLPDDSKNKEWRLTLEQDHDSQEDPLYNYVRIIKIKQLSIEKGVLMINSTFFSKNMSLAWFVLIPSQKIETGFESEEEFRQYIAGYGIQDPRWMTPQAAYEQFKETSCLYWIPDCMDATPEK